MRATLLIAISASMICLIPSRAGRSVANGEESLAGRVVRYDRRLREGSTRDDFVLRIIPDVDRHENFVRIVWRGQSSDDNRGAVSKLSPEVFVGRGPTWIFPVHAPSNVEESALCSSAAEDQHVVDESGSATIPAFVPTPGAETEQVPAIRNLPCYILEQSNLAVVKGTESPFSKDSYRELSLPGPPQSFSGAIKGRIVRYDWTLRIYTYDEDFIIRVLPDSGATRSYARVVWKHFSLETNQVDPSDKLDRSAFVGRGPTWVFRVRVPLSNAEKYQCTLFLPDRRVVDASGKTTLQRYMFTSGAEHEPVPPVEELPCYILDRGGMSVEKNTGGAGGPSFP
jgi:hypothetical protein